MQKASPSAVVKEQAVRIVRYAACAPSRLSISIRAFYHNQCSLKLVKFSIECDAYCYLKASCVKKVKNFKTFENLRRLSNIHEEQKYNFKLMLSYGMALQ